MLNTDFAALFKTLTDNIYNYLMFLAFLIILYVFAAAFIKLLTDCVIKVVLAIRAPINGKFTDIAVEEE